MSLSPLLGALNHVNAGIKVQNERTLLIAENIANAGSKGQIPYSQKLMSLKEGFDKNLGMKVVQISKIFSSQKPFESIYEPGNPAADINGNVKSSNVSIPMEMANLREVSINQMAQTEVFKKVMECYRNTISILK